MFTHQKIAANRHKHIQQILLRLSALSLGLLLTLPTLAANFTYQGQLDDFGNPANGKYDIRLAPYGSEYGKNKLAEALTFTNVQVKNGRFELEFEIAISDAEQTWLEVSVSDVDANQFNAIQGRSKAVAAPLIGQCWSTTGDSDSNPASNFLGTTDAQPLVLRTHNVQSLRIEPSSILFAGTPITTNTIAGSSANNVTAGVRGATIAGGGAPLNSDPNFFIEAPNRVTDSYGTVSGGFANRAGNDAGSTSDRPFATVGGGVGNTASGAESTVAGGDSNIASGELSTVAGGTLNRAVGIDSSVIGGRSNLALGSPSTVGGGRGNCAGGDFSFAAGIRAKVRHGNDPGDESCPDIASSGDSDGDEGTFVWADFQGFNEFISTGPSQFLIRSAGGVAINTNTPVANTALTVNGNAAITANGDLSFGSQTRQMLRLYGTEFGIGVQNLTSYQRSFQSFAWFVGGVHNDTQFNPGTGGTLLMSLTPGASSSAPTGTARAQSFVSVSDRAAKTAFADIDAVNILGKVLTMPITSWAYRNTAEVRHIGPVAQDFFSAFGLGSDDKTINTIDASGVALAAIQGLNEKLEKDNAALRDESAAIRNKSEKLETESAELRSESAQLKQRLAALEKAVAQIAARKE